MTALCIVCHEPTEETIFDCGVDQPKHLHREGCVAALRARVAEAQRHAEYWKLTSDANACGDVDILRARVERVERAAQDVADFAWSAVMADCDESRIHLNSLLTDLRTALLSPTPAGPHADRVRERRRGPAGRSAHPGGLGRGDGCVLGMRTDESGTHRTESPRSSMTSPGEGTKKMTKRPSVSSRDYYNVWCQAEGRDRDDRRYAAECLLCPGKPWLTEYAASRANAWAIAREHHRKMHATPAAP